jgi:hypothetical protein
MLYVADIDVIRWFDMKTGEPRGSVPVQGATRINDIEVTTDGTIYATQTATPNSGVPSSPRTPATTASWCWPTARST